MKRPALDFTPAGWERMEADWWPEACHALSANGEPWHQKMACMDLRWWAGQVRITKDDPRPVKMPGYRFFCQTWNWPERRTRKLMATITAWMDPRFMPAAADAAPAPKARRARTPKLPHPTKEERQEFDVNAAQVPHQDADLAAVLPQSCRSGVENLPHPTKEERQEFDATAAVLPLDCRSSVAKTSDTRDLSTRLTSHVFSEVNTPPPTPSTSVDDCVQHPLEAEALVQQWLREAKSIERPCWPAEVSMAQKLINDYGLQQAFEWVRQGTIALERSGMIARTVSFCGLKTVMGRPIVKPTYEEIGWQDNSRRTVSLEPIAADPASTTSSLGIAQVRTGDGLARGVVGAGEGGPVEAKSAEALVLLADTPENTGASDMGAVAGPPVVALSGAWPSSVPDRGGQTSLPPSRSGMPAPSGKVLTLPKCQVPMVFPDGLAVWARLLEQLDAAPAPEASSAIRLANARMERLRLKTRLRALLDGAAPEASEEAALADAVGRAVAVVPVVPVVSERRFAAGG